MLVQISVREVLTTYLRGWRILNRLKNKIVQYAVLEMYRNSRQSSIAVTLAKVEVSCQQTIDQIQDHQ